MNPVEPCAKCTKDFKPAYRNSSKVSDCCPECDYKEKLKLRNDKRDAKKQTVAKKALKSNFDTFTTVCKIALNVEVVKEVKFHPKRQWKFDYAIPELMIALEVEGGVWTNGRHTRGKGFLGDMEKYNTGTLLGWRILRVTPDTLISDKTLKMIESAIKYKP